VTWLTAPSPGLPVKRVARCKYGFGLPDPVAYPDFPPHVIVDVSNVAYGHSSGPPAQLRNVETVVESLRAARVEFELFVDASTFHKIDDPRGLREILRSPSGIDLIRFARTPAGTQADETIISRARLELEEYGRPVYILSGDKLRDHPSAEGIPRITFRFDRSGGVTFSPPLTKLLSRRDYLRVFPNHILSEGVPCPHTNVETSITNAGEISPICVVCSQVVPDWKFPADGSEED